MRKKLLLLLIVLLVLLAAVVPVFADSEDAKHEDHIPGWDNASREGNIENHPIPPGWAEAAAPGPLNPND